MASVPGLMDSSALRAPGADPGKGPVEAPGLQDTDTQATPEEENQMEQFLAQCKLATYDPKHPEATKAMLDNLKTGEPVPALAHTALSVVQRVEQAANEAGEQIDPAIMLQGGYAVVADIADFSNQCAKSQGTPTYDEKTIKQAYLIAVDLYRASADQQGKNDPQDAAAGLDQLKQAQANGTLDQVLPGATQAGEEGAAEVKEMGKAQAADAPVAENIKVQAPPKKKKRRR